MRPLSLLFILSFSFGNPSFAEPSLKTAKATLTPSALEQILNGQVEAINKATISAQVSGRVTTVNFDVDDVVKKGDVILRIRNTEYKARLKKTKAALKEAKALLKDIRKELIRITGLHNDKMVSDAIFDKTKAQLKSAEAKVTAGEARVTETQEQLDNTTIRAPYSGIVIARHIELGETIQPGKPVMTGFSMEDLRIAVEVSQQKIEAVREYQSARIIPLSQQLNKIKVKDIIIFPFADPKKHTFKVRVNLAKGTKSLFPGMLVNVAFKVAETQRLLIPSVAVVHRSEVTGTYIVDNNHISLRQIRLGHKYDDMIEVIAGLSAGELVATNPVKAGIKLKQQRGSTHE